MQHAQSSAVSSQQYPEYGNQPFSPPEGNLGNPYCWFWLPESCPPLGSISLCFAPSAGAVLVSGSPLSPGRTHHIPSDKEKPRRLSPSSLRVLHFSAPVGFPQSGAREALGLASPLTSHTDIRILCLSCPWAGAQSCGGGHCLCSSCSALEAATSFLGFDPRKEQHSTATSGYAALPVLKEKKKQQKKKQPKLGEIINLMYSSLRRSGKYNLQIIFFPTSSIAV